ncbi:hypothetical protein [Nostoc sp. WHI]|uniref:hypothetical protein n=1 Tax=Nostoc sp. WHI TaxID=2650611 RepID=UPI0018C50787|nr:hypothetical protein [Nostoc sp. WHI]
MSLVIETESGLILPGHPFFDDWLYCTLPPTWRNFAYHNPNFAFVARSGSGLLEAVTEDEMEDYIEGGEYDQRLEECGDYDDDD